MHWSSLSRLFAYTIVITLFSTTFAATGFLKYPFKADFDVRTVRYSIGKFPALSLNIVNKNVQVCDSIEVCIYFRSKEGLENDLAARTDLLVLYRADGFQDVIDSTLRRAIAKGQASQKPVKIDSTYDTPSQTYAYALTLPLYGIVLESQQRLRYDIVFNKRDPDLLTDLLDEPPDHSINSTDWTFGPHTIAAGDLIDFAGVDSLSKESVDTRIWELENNYYLTIYRKGELLCGIPPNWQTVYNKDTFTPTDTRPRQDPMPYALIAVPFDEYADRLVRDSANLTISPLRVNQAGYRPGDKQYFYCVDSSATTFSIINTENRAAVGSGTLANTGTTSAGQFTIRASNSALLVPGGDTNYILTGAPYKGPVKEGILPTLPEGRYRIVAGADTSAPFVIRHDVYNMVKDALLKFYGVNRCGDSKSWFHAPCHLKDAVTGGWHDCGDHLKEGATMSYSAAVLGLAAATFSDVDQDLYDADQSKTLKTDGIPDVLYEAKHGADFILRSYDLADGDVSKMITSIGGFGNTACGDDHLYWGPPELQDAMPVSRGGAPRCARSEPTTDYLGKYAANLAFVAQKIRLYNGSYADRCLAAAKAIYAFTLPKLDRTNTAAYTGSTSVSDDAAFGALALLWATGERKYLDDLCFDSTLGKMASPGQKALFGGGLFTTSDPVFTHTTANTDWASTHTHVLWGFFKLILRDKELCQKLNLTETERLTLIEKTAYALLANISSIGKGTETIPLPEGVMWIPSIVKYDLPWFTMQTQMEWTWNRYQAGNITDLFYYYDIASYIQGLALPGTPATTNWKAEEVKSVVVRMMDYMLGVNPWDISMIYGVGNKNFNHPHHRASNPELRTCFTDYPYRHLVGALQGGYASTTSLYTEYADDYMHAEVGIDGTTNMLMPALGLCVADRKVTARHGAKNVSSPIHSIRIIQKQTGGTMLIRSSQPLQSITLYSISGRVIEQVHAATSSTCQFALSSRTGNGTYLLRMKCADGSTITRLVSRIH